MTEAFAGAGIGLRSPHLPFILENSPQVPWFEVLVDNYLNHGVVPHRELSRIRERYPIVFHGVGMNLGSVDPVNQEYFERLLELIDRYEPIHVSDHLSWIGVDDTYANDLLPLPFTAEALEHSVRKIVQVQDLLGREILIENASSYVQFPESGYTEWEFLVEVARKSGCYLLLDINNVYVNAMNQGFDPRRYVEAIPSELVKQVHLAGFEKGDGCLIDTHGAAISEEVWKLYRFLLKRTGPLPTSIERDRNIPEFSVLWEEAERARMLLEGISNASS